ncbi:MAG TPA: hypothetical protein VK576_07220, partial [Thermoleophilia bacterium]|nr:hypothetical protein [Thermoleophilia bacterium]
FSGIGKNADGTYHTWKSLTCPSCGKRTRAVAVRVDTIDQEQVVDQGVAPARRAGASDTARSGGTARAVQRRGGRKRR